MFFLGSVANCCSRSEKVSLQEKRTLAPFPRLRSVRKDLTGFASKFEAFFQDRFYQRVELTTGRNLALLKIFHTSASDDVLVGNAGWLFFNNRRTGLRQALRHDRPFSDDALILWKKMFQYRFNALQAKGIRYIVVVAPEKSTIYPDQLPSWVKHELMPDRISQIQQCLAGTGIPFVNLEQDLLQQRRSGDVYFRTDSHWNDVGASIVARRILELVRIVCPNVPVISAPTFMQSTASGDLADLLALHGLLTERVTARLTPESVDTFPISGKLPPDKLARVCLWDFCTRNTKNDARNLPRAIMLHDSFGLTLIDFLAPYFSEIQFHTTHEFELQQIVAAKPDIVIEELAERHLYEYYPDNLPVVLSKTADTQMPANEIALVWRSRVQPSNVGDTEFGKRFELITQQATRTRSGVLLKLHWRSKLDQKLDYFYGIQCVGVQDLPVLAGHDMPQDATARHVQAGTEWIDTIEVPELDLRDACRIGFMVYKPGGEVLPITKGKSDSTGLRFPIVVPN
jgi:hypothetical protein